MRLLLVLTFIFYFVSTIVAQNQPLPKWMTDEEKTLLPNYSFHQNSDRGITTPPEGNLRTMAEWEETEYLLLTWVPNYSSTLTRITAAAVEETKVLIITNNPNSVTNTLTNANVPLNNVEFLNRGFNTVWIRDYAANTVYKDWNDERILVDWIYNRPRPLDNSAPEAYASQLNIPLYQMTEAPTDVIATGGNFMSDGFGTAFSSNLILDENGSGNNFNATVKSEADIDNIFQDFMGIETYIKMENLPYDAIDHIDMHMKLLDEETLLVSEYPPGVADGPQIEANLQYVLSNFNSVYGTPYRVVRIPSPPSVSGLFPDQNGHYRTYANQVFVNNTVIVPFYREEYDTIAQRILEDAMPGYKIVGVNVDGDFGEQLIAAGGAIHCITHAVGIEDPLMISHQRLRDTEDDLNPYEVSAYISHRSGIEEATLFYKTNLEDSYQSVSMQNTSDDDWTALIPAQDKGTTIYYYVSATANSGKSSNRPMPAPEGYWKFRVLGETANNTEQSKNKLTPFPNPATGITAIPVEGLADEAGVIELVDAQGRVVEKIYEGQFAKEEKHHFIHAQKYASGSYSIRIKSNHRHEVHALVIM